MYSSLQIIQTTIHETLPTAFLALATVQNTLTVAKVSRLIYSSMQIIPLYMSSFLASVTLEKLASSFYL